MACRLLVLLGDTSQVHSWDIDEPSHPQDVLTANTLEPMGAEGLLRVRSWDNRFVSFLLSPLAGCLFLPKSHRPATSGLTGST